MMDEKNMKKEAMDNHGQMKKGEMMDKKEMKKEMKK
jgi:hypothetical protein